MLSAKFRHFVGRFFAFDVNKPGVYFVSQFSWFCGIVQSWSCARSVYVPQRQVNSCLEEPLKKSRIQSGFWTFLSPLTQTIPAAAAGDQQIYTIACPQGVQTLMAHRIHKIIRTNYHNPEKHVPRWFHHH